MILKKIHIHNIASLENAELDFDQKPLSTARLFLICGDTGSGKSTLLDAICLALYGVTPRLRMANNRKKEYGRDIISAQDSRNLMRHGATEASVELTFIGEDGKEYVAGWHARRTRNMTLDLTKRSLTVDDIPVDRKEMEAALLNAVGMDFDQFCRTTMLAQGQFTQFLKSSEDEKSKILEKMTRTEQYSIIGQTIFKMCGEAERTYRDEKAKADAINLMEKDEREAVLQDLELTTAKKDKTKLQQQTIEAKFRWMEKEKETLAAKQAAEHQLAICREQVEAPQFKADEQRVADFDLSATARADYDTLRQQKERMQRILTEKEPNARKQFAQLAHSKTLFAETLQKEQQDCEEKRKQIESEAEHEPMYAQYQTITAKLDEVVRYQTENQNDDSECKRLQDLQPALKQELLDREKAEKNLEKSTAQQHNAVQQAEQALGTLNPDTLATDRQNVGQKQTNLNTALVETSRLESALQKAQTIRDNIADKENTRQAETKKLEAAKPLEAERKTAYEQSQEAIRAAELAIGDQVQAIRAQLKTGDVCPVCGQVIHNLLSDDAARQILDPLQADLDAKKAVWIEKQSEIKASESILKDCQIALEKLKREEATATAEVTAAHAKVRECCRKIAVEVPELSEDIIERLKTGIDTVGITLQEEREKLNERQKKVDNQQKTISSFKDMETELHKKLATAQQETQKASNLLREQTQNLENRKQQIKNRNIQIAKNLQEVSQCMTIPGWQEQWEQDATGFVANLKNKAESYRQLQEEHRKLSVRIQQAETSLKNMNHSCDQVLKLWTDWTTEDEPAGTLITEKLDDLWNSFAVNAGKLFEAKRSAEEEINRLEENLQQFYSQHPAIQEERLIEFRGYANIEDLRQTCRERREALARAQGAVETCTEAYNRHHESEHPPFVESDTVESLRQALDMGLKTLEDMSKKITTLENQLNHDAAERVRQEGLLQKVAHLEATAQKWNTLNECFGGSDGMRFRLIAQSYLLENLLRSANLYLHDLDKRYKLECIPGTLTISLRDQYQPDMVSPVDTLSGGESFIVSLALALALASMNRQGLSIDTLFIDEGFGTLSENELNTVMTLLERLQAQKGKRVGVISHVRELRDRIPVHVEVRRLDPTRSGVRVTDRTAG